MQPHTFLFDLDGVVIKKHSYFSQQLAEDFGVDPQLITPFFTTDFPACLVGRADLKTALLPYLVTWGWKKPVEDLLEYWFAFESTLDQELLAEVRKLRAAGNQCYLATNNEKYRTEYIKQQLGLAKEFDGVFSSAYLGCTKSEPRFWSQVITALGLPASDMTLWDDDADNVAKAKQAGLQAFFYSNYPDFQQTIDRWWKSN